MSSENGAPCRGSDKNVGEQSTGSDCYKLLLVACITDERALKIMFQTLILATLGAFRAVEAGVREGMVKAPWKTLCFCDEYSPFAIAGLFYVCLLMTISRGLFCPFCI
jgi:hypothetical protein